MRVIVWKSVISGSVEDESESLSDSENEIELNIGDSITGEWGGEEKIVI